ncbi:MAG: C39 family peptidase [Candidatus Sumerlaeia bacterium]|nr:C39 family peptidase [Candidatus Sumerlaeia bacterium]
MCRTHGFRTISSLKTAFWILAVMATVGSFGTAWGQLQLGPAAPAAGTGATVTPALAEKAARFYAQERWPGSRLVAVTPYYAFDGTINAYAFQFAKEGSALAGEAEVNALFLQREKRLDDVRANRPVASAPAVALAHLGNRPDRAVEFSTTASPWAPSTGGVRAVLPTGAVSFQPSPSPEEAGINEAALKVWRQQIRAAAQDSVLSDQIGTVLIAARYDLYPLLERFDGVAPHIRHQTTVRRLAAVPVTQPNPIARTYYAGAMAVLHEPVLAEPAPLGATGPLRLVNPINGLLHEVSPQQRATLSGRLPAAEPGRWPVPPQDFWKAIDLNGNPPAGGKPQPLATPTVSIIGVPYYHQDDYGANSCGPVASAQALGYWDDNGLGNLVHAGFADTGNEDELIFDLMKSESYSPTIGTYGNQIEPGIEAVTNNDAYGRRLSVESTSYYSISWTTHIKNEINARRPFVFFNWNTEIYPYWAHFVTGMGYNETSGHLLFVNYNYPPDSPYELNWDNISSSNQAVYTINRSSTTLFDCPWSDGFESGAGSTWDTGRNGTSPYWGRTTYRAHNSAQSLSARRQYGVVGLLRSQFCQSARTLSTECRYVDGLWTVQHAGEKQRRIQRLHLAPYSRLRWR